MPRSIVFNGVVLFRPGASTRVDASRFQVLALAGVNSVGLVGEADDGQPNVLKTFVDSDSLKAYYKSGPLVDAGIAAAAPSKDPRIPGGAGLIACVKVNQSTQSSYLAKTASDNAMTLTSKKYGTPASLVTVTIAAGTSSGRIVTLKDKSAANQRTEVSPELGATGKFTIVYTGTGMSASLVITPTTLTITTDITADNVSLPFSSYKTLADLIAAIQAKPYTVVTLISSASRFKSTDLDYVAALDVMTLKTIYARNFDIADWVNRNSSIATAVRSVGSSPIGATWPDVITEKFFTGATAGGSSNTNWVSAFTLLGTINVQQVVPCASADGASPSTYTFASVAAAGEAHARLYSSTAGRSERQVWIGGSLSKTALLAEAVALNSEHACLVGQQPQIQFQDGTIDYADEYIFAALLAGMRAGAPLGEPLTWKFPNTFNVKVRDGSWDPENETDAYDLITNGIIFARNVVNKGVRIERGLTTFLKLDNDAYTEESIVQGWKNIARTLRGGIEDTFTGTRSVLTNIQGIIPTAYSICDKLRDQGQIVDSIEDDGSITDGFGNFKLTYAQGAAHFSCQASPVEGINWELVDIFLVPQHVSI